jgi:hypothetical protein
VGGVPRRSQRPLQRLLSEPPLGSPNTPLRADVRSSADGADPDIFHACEHGRLSKAATKAEIKPAVKPKMSLPPAVVRSADSLVGR